MVGERVVTKKGYMLIVQSTGHGGEKNIERTRTVHELPCIQWS